MNNNIPDGPFQDFWIAIDSAFHWYIKPEVESIVSAVFNDTLIVDCQQLRVENIGYSVSHHGIQIAFPVKTGDSSLTDRVVHEVEKLYQSLPSPTVLLSKPRIMMMRGGFTNEPFTFQEGADFMPPYGGPHIVVTVDVLTSITMSGIEIPIQHLDRYLNLKAFW